MNILLATSSAVPSGGGVASYNEELVHLFGQSHNIYLLTAADEGTANGYVEVMSTFGKNWKTFEYAQKVIQKLKEWRIDIVINSDSQLMAILAPFVEVPIVTVSHFVNGKCALNAGYNSKFLSQIVSLSNYGKKYLEKAFNIEDKKKVNVIYNFVANKDLPCPEKKISNNPLTIVYPGGTSIKKSVDVVMRTLYKLLNSNLDFRFVWLGQTILPLAKLTTHKTTTQFFKKDKRLIITDRVTREESIRYMEDANVFLLPSRGEGCPMTLLEAMRAGCIPVVSDSQHGSREILEQGGFGKIVKQGNSEDLFMVIKDIIENHDKYQGDYLETYNYSKTSLSQFVWAQKMMRVIDLALKVEKEYIKMDTQAYNNSLSGFEKQYKRIRREEQIESMKCRLYLEYMYYFVR